MNNACYRGVFKRTANAVKEGLAAKNVKGVTINDSNDKPRRGSFVVSVVGQPTPVVEMLGLTRPFAKLRALDVAETVNAIVSSMN